MPIHPDFQKILNNFIKQYGQKKGKQIYYAWLNKMGYDDTKPFPKEQLGIGGTDVCVCPNCGYEMPHERGTPCSQIKCPKCGTKMVGKGMPHGLGKGGENMTVKVIENQKIEWREKLQVLEVQQTEGKKRLKVGGTALYETVSRNGRKYVVEEIQKHDGKEVKIFVEHKTEASPVGKARLMFENGKLKFEGWIKNTAQYPDLIENVQDGLYDVSIGAAGTLVQEKEGDAVVYRVKGLDIREISLVGLAGVDGATIEYAIAEKFQDSIEEQSSESVASILGRLLKIMDRVYTYVKNNVDNKAIVGETKDVLDGIALALKKLRGEENMETNIEEAKLTYAQRKALPASAFVFPKERKYPIHDRAHAINALARVQQFGTPEEKRKVIAAVCRRYPDLPTCKERRKKASESDCPECYIYLDDLNEKAYDELIQQMIEEVKKMEEFEKLKKEYEELKKKLEEKEKAEKTAIIEELKKYNPDLANLEEKDINELKIMLEYEKRLKEISEKVKGAGIVEQEQTEQPEEEKKEEPKDEDVKVEEADGKTAITMSEKFWRKFNEEIRNSIYR